MKTVFTLLILAVLSCSPKKEPEVISGQRETTLPIEQTLFRMSWDSGEKAVAFKSVLHSQGRNRVSIAIMKGGSRILTIWKQGKDVWIYFPREKKVFQGSAEQPIMIFRHWPVYSVNQWIELFNGDNSAALRMENGDYQISPEEGRHLRWHQIQKKIRPSVPAIVFTPAFPSTTRTFSLLDLNREMERTSP